MEKVIRSVCYDCHQKCGVLVHVRKGKIIRIEGDPNHPGSKGTLCNKAMTAKQIHEHPDRLKYPLRRVGERGEGKWKRISWEEAYDEMETRIRKYWKEYGKTSVITAQGTGRSYDHWHMRFNSGLGIEGAGLWPAHVCLSPFLFPFLVTWGSFVFSAYDADVERANTAVIWGANLICSTPILGHRLIDAKARGCKFIVIDPRFIEMAAKADIWLQPRPGTDGALALGFMNVIINEELYDKEFVENWTFGFDDLKERVRDYPVEKVEEITWVPKEKIAEAARLMAQNRPTSIMCYLGVGCMQDNAIPTGHATTNLQAILGMVDREGGTLLDPSWDWANDPRMTLLKPEEPRKALGQEEYPAWGMARLGNLPTKVWRAVLTEKPWPVKMLVFNGNDPLRCYEEPQKVYEALQKVDFHVTMDYFITQSGELADILLPAAHWIERSAPDEEGLVFPFPIICMQKAVDPPGEAKSDWTFYREFIQRFDPDHWPWKSDEEMYLWRLKEFYGVDITWEELVEKGYIVQPYPYRRFEKAGGFRTESGKIELFSTVLASLGYDPLPKYIEPSETPVSNPALARGYPLILITGSRLYPYYHSAWTNIPWQRELEPDPFVEMNPKVAMDVGISEGDWVRVESPRGSIKAKARITKGIDPRVVSLPRSGWKHACKELGLPGYSWEETGPNKLIPAEPADKGFGSPNFRATLCRIRGVEV